MNIAQLFHNQTELQTIPHWPVFIINSTSKQWYFYSSKQCTLRKKIQNTSIIDFINVKQKSNNSNNQSSQKQTNRKNQDVLIQLRQIDRRQPRQRQLYQIKTNKIAIPALTDPNISQHALMTQNDWYATQNSQITLYRVSDLLHNKIYSLLWSLSVISCNAQLTSHLRQKLMQYCESICNKAQQKLLNKRLQVKQFQLVFTYNQSQGKVRALFAHNFKLMGHDNENYQKQGEFGCFYSKEMYMTDFKIGRDQYECIQLLMEEQKKQNINKQPTLQNNEANKHLKQLLNFPIEITPPNFNQKQQKSRLTLLKTLQKLHPPQSAQIRNLNIIIKKQINPIQKKRQYQCSACFCYVVLQQFQHQNIVTRNRIPQIQILRQVKMRKNTEGNGTQYDLVPVCQLCFNKFKQIVQNKQASQNRNNKLRHRSLTNKQSSRASIQPKNKINKSLSKPPQTTKNAKLNYNLTQQFLTKQYTTKTNTTIRQQAQHKKQKNNRKFQFNLSRQKVRKQSFQQNSICQNYLSNKNNIKFLLDKSCRTSNARTNPHIDSRQNKQTYHSFNQKVINKQILSLGQKQGKKQLQFEKQTDDQLQIALEQYAGFDYQAQRNKRIARFIRNKHNKFQLGKCQREKL